MSTTPLTPWRHKELVSHPSARVLDSGWVILADRNWFQSVILVSRHRQMAKVFTHEEPYHSYLRAQIMAEAYADTHPELPEPAANELVIQPLTV